MRKRTEGQIFWVVGAGKFGAKAVQALVSENPRVQVVLVDSDPRKLKGWDEPVETVATDGVTYLVTGLKQGRKPDWIIPAIPLHVALELIGGLLPKEIQIEPIPIPAEIRQKLPNPIIAAEGQLWVSHATFLCPANCSEPDEYCTVTRKPRNPDMYRLLEELNTSVFNSVVVRSRQLAPGVGGYRPADIDRALSEVRRSKGAMLVCTACRCHGVVNAIRTI
ncbi:MAG: potassium transporter [Deltaproteobacteria bacterium]|nr:potassium transporter [Deltaproteobacteria bacterium]